MVWTPVLHSVGRVFESYLRHLLTSMAAGQVAMLAQKDRSSGRVVKASYLRYDDENLMGSNPISTIFCLLPCSEATQGGAQA